MMIHGTTYGYIMYFFISCMQCALFDILLFVEMSHKLSQYYVKKSNSSVLLLKASTETNKLVLCVCRQR